MTEPPGCRPRRPSVSFELFPPRTPRGEEALWDAVDHLLAARPDFVSVTYGASGSTRDTSRDVVRRLLSHTAATPVAHLTCLGSSRTDLAAIIEEFLDEGVRSFLALRGDPPKDAATWRPPPDGVATAAELVGLLREVEARRRDDYPGIDLVGALRPLTVGVAAFPCGNRPLGGTREQDIAALLAKQEAGADYAITQLFFRAEDYLSYVATARAAGVRIPVLPGVIPMTDPARLERVSRLTGIEVPAEVLDRIAAGSTDAERYRRGLAATVELATAVLDGGAPGLHVYTFNTHRAALDLLDGVHLGGGAWTVPGPARPGPAQPSPAQPSPAQPSPAQPSPAQPSRGIT